MMENEIWAKIKNIHGYEVSTFGKIRSVKKVISVGSNGKIRPKYSNNNGNSNIISAMVTTSNGYLTMMLGNEIKYIHKIVAETFIPNPFGYSQVRHIDNNRTNNNVKNLEWTNLQQSDLDEEYINNIINADFDVDCDDYHNNNHENVELIHGKRRGKPTIAYTLDGVYVCKYNSITEAALNNNLSRYMVSSVAHMQKENSGGFIWRFENTEGE